MAVRSVRSVKRILTYKRSKIFYFSLSLYTHTAHVSWYNRAIHDRLVPAPTDPRKCTGTAKIAHHHHHYTVVVCHFNHRSMSETIFLPFFITGRTIQHYKALMAHTSFVWWMITCTKFARIKRCPRRQRITCQQWLFHSCNDHWCCTKTPPQRDIAERT